MITRKLKVGDYIFDAQGRLARITKVNKATYSFEVITNAYQQDNVAFNGKKHTYWGQHEEWFECDDAQAKALELAFNKWKTAAETKQDLQDTKDLIGKAKFFLNQIKDIEEVEIEEEMEENYDD